jgi:hypothetical protein
MSLRLATRLLAGLVPVVLLLPAAAHAEKVVTDDAVGDAQAVSADVPDGSAADVVFTPAPDETATDITRTVVAHGTTRLSVTVHLRDLVLTSSSHQTYVRVATPRLDYTVTVSKSPGSRATTELRRKNGRETECRGLRAAVDGDTDTVSLSLPTACINAPRWVQVGVGVVRVADPAPGSEPAAESLFADDGHRDGDIRENDVALGPRVRRG